MADPKIKIRRSATPNKVPSKDQLQLGELAINTYDGKLYLEQDQGGVGVGNTVVVVNPWSVGVGSTAYNTHFTAGKVGVGTTNAQYNLDVGGNVNFTGNLYQNGSLFTSGSTGVGIATAGGIAGYAATVIDFRGPGVTTAYYSSATGIGTVYFHSVTSGGGGGGGASVTVSDSAPGSPSNGDLWFKSDVGELYVYYTDGSSNQWVEASGGSNTVITSDNAPTSPQDGDLWWNSNNGELKVYYNDGNTSQWVDANSEGGFIQYWTQTNTNGTLGVTTTGFVGIGTTTATDALTVVGAADIDGNLIVSGVSTFSGNINLLDGISAKFGTDLDGEIKHTGNNLQIQEATGNIQITNYANDKDVDIKTDDGSGGTARYFLADGSTGEAILYNYGNEKIKTTSTGASVTGDLVASGNVTGVAATFTGNVTVGGVLTYEDVKNVDAIGIVTARKGIKALAGGANIVDGTTTDELNVTGIATFAGITTSTGTIFGKQLSISGISTLKNTVVGGATTELVVHGDARITGVLSVGQGTLSINERDIFAVGVFTGANFKTGTSNLHSAGVEVAGVNVNGADTPIGLGATVYNSGLIVGKQGAEFQGVVTASSFSGSGANLTDVISGVGIGTEGGVVGYAATILHFKGAGVTTAYYSSTTGIGTIFFHSATTGGGGGGANVTVSDTPPGSPTAGDLWWESDIGELKIYYSDGDSSQWVDANGADSLVQIGTSAPTGAVSGDLWFNSETGDFMVYYADANTSQWVSVNAVNANTKWITNATGIHTTGNVGIGTTTATDPLTVVGAADIDGRLIVSGITTFGSHVYHGDNDRAIFGDGSDLEIYHSGSESIIKDSGTGNLKLIANVVDIRNAGDSGYIARFKQSDAVQLYFNNSEKLTTSNTGVSITGDIVGSGSTAYSTGLIVGKQGAEFQGVVTATTFVGALTGNANTSTLATNAQGLTGTPNITVGSVTASTGQFSGNVNVLGTLTYEDVKNVDSAGIATARQGLRVTGGGLDVVGVSTFNADVQVVDSIVHAGDSDTKIRFSSADTVSIETAGVERFHVNSGGAVKVTSGALRLTKEGASNSIEIGQGQTGDNYAFIDLIGDTTYSDHGLRLIRGNTGANATSSLVHRGTGGLYLIAQDAGHIVFQTNGSSRASITSAGKVGINTTTPTAQLDVEANGSGYIAEFRQKASNNSGQIIIDSPTDNNLRPASIDLANAGTVKWSLGQAYASSSSGAFHIATSALQSNDNGARLTISTAGRVGIGTDIPATKLDVLDSQAEGILSRAASTQNTDTNKALKVRNAFSSIDTFNVSYKGKGYFAGRVGIGTDNPGRALEVYDATHGQLRIRGGGSGSNSSRKADLNFFASGARSWIIRADAADAALKIIDESGGDANRFHIDTSGRVGIGTDNPAQEVHIQAATPMLLIEGTNTSSGGIVAGVDVRSQYYRKVGYSISDSGGTEDIFIGRPYGSGDTNPPLVFNFQGTERIRINSNGGCHIGLPATTNAWDTHAISLTTNSATFACPGTLALFGGTGFATANMAGAGLRFVGYYAAGSFTTFAHVAGVKENTTSGDYGGALTFHTRQNGAMGAERIRITSLGRLLVGTSAVFADGDGYIQASVAGANLGAWLSRSGTTSGRLHMRFANTNGVIGYISTSGSGTSYNTSSDYRLKENEVAISDGITRLKTLKPYRFNFKTEPSKTVDGFFAHEVTPAVPEAISGEKDGEEMQGIDQSKLVPLLTAALQEAITKIETLETRVAALEGS